MSTLTNKKQTQTVGSLLNTSLKAYSQLLNSGIENLSQIKLPSLNNDCDTCPPKEECPPKFIGKLYRQAMQGERIIIPFIVQNSCSDYKTYRIGIRELKNLDGDLAPTQPVLNKNLVTLPPNASERVLLGVNLAQFTNGTYQAEIVIRENLYNQNILLTLDVEDYDAPIFSPYSEKKYQLKWQSWKSHFYCEKPIRKPTQNG